tara:strand:+ start:6546 stop:6734 length:189 start_codon:yes stop_codon:yes gene_type:complete
MEKRGRPLWRTGKANADLAQLQDWVFVCFLSFLLPLLAALVWIVLRILKPQAFVPPPSGRSN